MKRVLITGATGFVGANLARRLVRDGHEVHAFVRPGHSLWRIADIQPHLRVHDVDLEDAERVARVSAAARPEWVFHLAAYGAYSWETDAGRMARTNILGTVHLVEACLRTGFEAFVHAGSSSEYGFKDHAPQETEPLDPNSDYAVTKAAATLWCRQTGMSRGLRLSTLRLYSVFGPYEDPRRFFPTLIRHGLRGQLPPLVCPDTARDYVYIDDVVDAFRLAASIPSQDCGAIYNVGTGAQTTIREVVAAARRLLGIAAEPVWSSMPARSWDTSTWVGDSTRIRAAIGWRPRHRMEQGLALMAAWFRDNPAVEQVYRTLDGS